MTKLLLQEVGRRIHLFNVQQHKTIWKSVVTAFNDKGYNVSAEHCNNKWKSLKKRYKTIKDNNKQSGAGRRYWNFFDAMDEILKKNPEITPLSLASNTDGFRIYVNTDEEENEENLDEVYLNMNDNGNTHRPTNTRRSRKEHEPYWAKELRQQRERHHKENLQQKERFLSLLEKYYDET